MSVISIVKYWYGHGPTSPTACDSHECIAQLVPLIHQHVYMLILFEFTVRILLEIIEINPPFYEM